MIVNNKYWLWEGAMPSDWCDNIINYIEKQDLQEGKVGDKEETPSEDVRKSFVTFTTDKNLLMTTKSHVFEANKAAGWNFDIDAFENIQLSRYGVSNHYSWHVDSFPVPEQDMSKGMPFYRKVRKLSLVINLSDENSYEGGDFWFDYRNNSNGESNMEKLEKFRKRGSVVVFPSFLWHRVDPVKKGVRYSLVNWVNGWPWK
jgi:PKHD-type hydroxylase